MKVGFTGTQVGMTDKQHVAFKSLIHFNFGEFHHGICIGADAQAHRIVRAEAPLVRIYGHPPLDRKKMQQGLLIDHMYGPKNYLDRNHDIVDKTDVLWATPKGFDEELRSGTWATIRYARKLKRKIIIIFPDGIMYKENF